MSKQANRRSRAVWGQTDRGAQARHEDTRRSRKREPANADTKDRSQVELEGAC